MISPEDVLKVLKMIQEEGPVTARELSENCLGMRYGNDKTGPYIRDCVHAIRMQGYFVSADQVRGYSIETDPDEQERYLEALRKRIASIQEMYDALEAAMRKQQAEGAARQQLRLFE